MCSTQADGPVLGVYVVQFNKECELSVVLLLSACSRMPLGLWPYFLCI